MSDSIHLYDVLPQKMFVEFEMSNRKMYESMMQMFRHEYIADSILSEDFQIAKDQFADSIIQHSEMLDKVIPLIEMQVKESINNAAEEG